jgi:hypothetical protein
LFVAVGITGAGNRIMTSPDGADPWTSRVSPADYAWWDVIWVDDESRRSRHRGGELWGIIPEVAPYLG